MPGPNKQAFDKKSSLVLKKVCVLVRRNTDHKSCCLTGSCFVVAKYLPFVVTIAGSIFFLCIDAHQQWISSDALKHIRQSARHVGKHLTCHQ